MLVQFNLFPKDLSDRLEYLGSCLYFNKINTWEAVIYAVCASVWGNYG